jgi:hypothetical protein
MHKTRLPGRFLGSTILLSLCILFIASCDSPASTPTTTTTSCLTVSTGTVKTVNKNTLMITSLQGKDVQITFTNATTFIRQSTLTTVGLKTGMLVSVIVAQNADNTYSALTISVRNSLTRQAGFTGGSRSCGGQFSRGTGTPGASGRPGFGKGTPGTFGGGQGRQSINGTVSQVNGDTLTVTDTSGNNFTLTLTAATRITDQQTVSASNLQSGEAVTITGTANSQGVISASSVSILQGLPGRRPTATPTTTKA